MAARSAELLDVLERLRPIATPGALSTGAEQREARDRQLEVESVATTLACLEATALAIVEQARGDAEAIYEHALDEVRRIDDEVGARVVTAASRAPDRDHPEADQRAIMLQAAADAERSWSDADAKISEIVTAATSLVWETLTPPTALRVA